MELPLETLMIVYNNLQHAIGISGRNKSPAGHNVMLTSLVWNGGLPRPTSVAYQSHCPHAFQHCPGPSCSDFWESEIDPLCYFLIVEGILICEVQNRFSSSTFLCASPYTKDNSLSCQDYPDSARVLAMEVIYIRLCVQPFGNEADSYEA